MCEVLPTIDETSPSPDGENSRLEQLMISMLEERDKLMEKLRESQDVYNEATRKLSEVEADNSVLMRQLQAFMPDEEERLHSLLDEIRSSGSVVTGTPAEMRKWPVAKKFAQLARDLSSAKEKILEKEEEVQELKAERNNTRLLLEHLECLVARHERSLRMTVVKRQTSNAGVSSEVEVLKALKSLFDHHKALDEKVRERLRSAQERNMVLEDELMLANQEMKSLQDENKRMKRLIQQRNSVRLSVCYDSISFTKEQLALLEDRDQTIGDLQFSLDERTAQLEEAMHVRDELMERVQELEEEVAMAVKEFQKEQQVAKSSSKQLASSRSKLESLVSELHVQLSEAGEEVNRLRDINQQLSVQLSVQETKMVKMEEELVNVRSELKQKETALQKAKTANEERLRQQSEQLSQAEQRHGSAEVKIQQLSAQLETRGQDLAAAQEKELINEGHISRLQLTIERMLKEANERMKTHSAERKALFDEKGMWQGKAESFRQDLASSQQQNERLQEQIEQLRRQLQEQQSSNLPSHPPSKLRYSWQVTDIDNAITQHNTQTEDTAVGKDDTKPPSNGVTGEGVEGESEGGWDLGEPEAVSQLVSMLEGHVSNLDKQLESMGENEKADEFDRVILGMAEGNFTSSDLEPLPLSSPPGSRPGNKKYRPESLPRAIYRVHAQSEALAQSPVGSNDSSEAQQPGTSKHKMARSRGSFSRLFRRKDRGRSHKKNASHRLSAPVPSSARQVSESVIMRESVDFSDFLNSTTDMEEETRKKSEKLNEVLAQGVEFAQWDGPTVVAWLEVWVGMPFWYIAAIRCSIHSGALLANITEAELEQELGITNTFHRLKLRLAVQEIVTLTSSANPQLARTTSLYGEMGHEWIGDYWLPSLGLPQYSEIFKACLVDARMLEHLTKKDLRTVLKMVDASHRNSLQYGISVLKKLDYNRSEFEQRRAAVIVENKKDVLVWTNEDVISWVDHVGLGEYAPHLKESGVHGGVIALDNDFDHEKLALALQIPQTNPEVRKQLKTEFGNLLVEGTRRATSEPLSHGKIVRKLSKRLKVGSRKVTPPNEFMAVRPTSPVLYSTNPTSLHLPSLLEDPETPSPHHSNTNSMDLSESSRPHTPTELTV